MFPMFIAKKDDSIVFFKSWTETSSKDWIEASSFFKNWKKNLYKR